MRLLSLSSLLFLLAGLNHGERAFVAGSTDTGVYPPGLLPLINKANILLSSGQFSEAAKIYSEAIEQSPTDYLLYYKRATAYLSLQRHTSALDDFDKVLSLTSNTFDSAHLMKARIHTRDGHFPLAHASLNLYVKAKGKDKEAEDLEKDIVDGETMRKKAGKERNAELWNACVDSASQVLRVASHSIEVRVWRAECALAAGDIESSTGDLTRLSHLLPPSTQLLMRIFKLSYFLLPPSPAPLNTLKQCLHYDPDSKPCLALRRMVKGFDKSFAQLEELRTKEDWKGIVKLLIGPGGGKSGDLWKKFEEALLDHVGQESEILPLLPPSLISAPSEPSSSSSSTTTKPTPKSPKIPLPLATKLSPLRQTLVSSLCKSYTRLADVVKSSTEYKKQMDRWCEELLTLDGRAEDVDGLIGRGESLLAKEEWEDAVRVLEKAFEASGRSDRDIHARLGRAQKLLKQSKQKDYYKILGVARDADGKTIKKAFRKGAKAAHPDKGGSEAKMAALNEAYEVLSSPELRARFDAGEDPNDPMAQQGGHPFAYGPAGGGGHPFAQFFQQGGGFPGGGQGGYQFHFSHGH